MTALSRMPHLCLGAALLSSTALAPVLAQAQAQAVATAEQYQFNLPSQDLAEAMLGFSRTTGLQMASSPSALRGLRSHEVSGAMTAGEALNRLTAGLAVDAQIVGKTVVVAPRQASRVQATAADASFAPAPERRVQADVQVAEIVVTGYRESLDQALAAKKIAVGSQDVILAQDIGSFPDQNLAEALQRVPGVTISRDSGEGRQISLRGLGPEFTRTQLNGMEVLSNTSSGLDSRSNISRTRSFDYSVFASELFNRVTVQKYYAAELDEGGIGGTIDLRSAKPFDYDGRTAVVSAKAQSNEYTDDVTPRLVGLFADQWGDLGVLVSAAYSRADTIEFGYRNWNWSQVNFGAANVGPEIDTATRDLLVNAKGADRVWMSRAQTYASWFNQRERLGLTGTLQYQPGEATDVTLDVLYAKLSNDREESVLGAAGTNGVSANDIRGTQVLRDIAINEHDDVTGATFTGVDMRSEGKETDDETEFWQVALNGTTQLNDRLTLAGTLGWSRSRFDSLSAKVYLEAVGHGYSFSGLDTDNPRNSYDFDVTDPSQWDLQGLETRADLIQSEFVNAQANLAWELNDIAKLRFGGAFKRFENEGYQLRRNDNFENTNILPNPPSRVTTLPTLAPYIVADVDPTYAALGVSRDLGMASLVAGTQYGITEETFSGFVQYDLDTEIAGVGVRANAGVRYYSTDLVSAGTALVNGVLSPVETRSSYDGFLPAVNIALDLNRAWVVRLSANRNISRPSLDALRAAGTIRVASYGGQISAGNPNLEPFVATSAEGSVEFYDGDRGFVALGVYYKDMESFITSETTQVPYNTTGYPLSLLEPGMDPATLFNYARPINGPGASIKGVELAAQRDFDFLPAPFDGFGAIGNVTWSEGSSEVFYSGVPYDLPLQNLSKWSYNATLYYETERAGARVSAAYRSRYRVGDGGNGNIGGYILGATYFDAQAYYDVTPNLKLTLEAINLTDEPIIQTTDNEADRLMTNTVSGRTIALGATLRF